MKPDLQGVLDKLRNHERELRQLGVVHAAVFGSVATGENRKGSDIDVMVELDEGVPIGIFEYARLKLYIGEILAGPSDVVNRRTLKPLLRGCARTWDWPQSSLRVWHAAPSRVLAAERALHHVRMPRQTGRFFTRP